MIAIIVMLISLLLPALGGARDAARAVACMSNQRQILTALGQYENANKDMVPREGTVDNLGLPELRRDYLSWAVALRPFVDERATASSDIDDLFEWAPYYRDPARRPDGHKIHFMANAMPFLSPGIVDEEAVLTYRFRRGPTPMQRLHFPEQTAYLGEYTDDPNGEAAARVDALAPRDLERAQYYDVWAKDHILPGPLQRITARRHGDGGNVGFLDGHVRAAPSRELVELSLWDDRDYGQRYGGN